MRPGTTAGRKIMHHVLAHLMQDEPPTRLVSDDGTGDAAGRGGGSQALDS